MGHLEEFSRWPAQRFIETGFGEGRTLTAAAKVYSECISIELYTGRYLAAMEMFKHQPHVRIFHGNSPDILRHIVDPSISTVFWLDAHYVKADAVKVDAGQPLCPILEELSIIKALTWTEKATILIDDWSTFRTHSNEWPDLKKLDEVMGMAYQRYPELPGGDVFGYEIVPPPPPEPLPPRAELLAEVRSYLPPVLREKFDRVNAEMEEEVLKRVPL